MVLAESPKEDSVAVDHSKARLALYPGFQTCDADEARVVFSRQNRCFRMEPVGGRYHLSSHTAVLDSLAISSMRQSYPRNSWLEPDARHFVLFLCYQGGNKYVCGNRTFTIDSGQGLLLPPDRESYIESSGEQDLVAIRIPAEGLLTDARNLVGGRPLDAIEPLGTIAQESAVWQMAEYMVSQLDEPTGIFTVSPLAGRDLQHAFRTALLQSTPNTCQMLLDADNGVAFWHVRVCKRAEEYMDAHLGEYISLPALAEAAGVSIRRLENSFRICRHKTPMEVLREMRIWRIHDDLLHLPPDTRIREIRLAYGLSGSGRFARDYYQLIGETPSETERKSKHRG